MDALQSFPPELWNSPAPNDPTYELGFAVEALWYDAYLHADDIRVALGLTPHHGDGLRCAVHHIAGYLDHQSWRPATLELTGIEPIHISGGGPAITGDPRLFVLCATGRGDPIALGLDASVNVYAKQPDRSPTGPAQRPR